MSEIKTVGQTWIAKCNQLTPLPFKGLSAIRLIVQDAVWPILHVIAIICQNDMTWLIYILGLPVCLDMWKWLLWYLIVTRPRCYVSVVLLFLSGS